MSVNRPHRLAATAAVLALLLAAGPAAAGEFQKTFRFDADDLQVAAMVGRIEVRPAAGDAFEVTVHVRGADADEGLVSFVEEKDRLRVEFPLDEHDRYVYPEMGGRQTTIRFRDHEAEESSWLKKIFDGMNGQKITVTGDGRGLELWTDVTIAVPRGAGLVVRHGVGAVEARRIVGDLDLDTHSGAIAVEDLAGDLRADTGSGAVVANFVEGNVDVDTGSGAVALQGIEGDKVLVDTGSGGVTADGIACGRFLVDTGSGSVRARHVAADAADIDTGSGGVTLQLDRMGTGRFVIDTGSGGIDLVLPPDASARISADTGSGSVQADLDGATVEHQERSEMRLTVGGGDARVILDAGSGSITVKGS